MTIRRIDIAKPSTGTDEWEALREPLESGWLTQGPRVAEFEKAFAERHHVRHALATTNCTTALHLALMSLGVGPGHEVIVPAFTWVATANVVLMCGATPVFVDVEATTYNLDPELVAAAVTERTRAVIPVHLFGLCADMDAIRAVVPADVALVEDAACAAGASYRGRPAGGLGRAGCFSFHPRKSITTGEGGMLTTDDASLADHANRLRNHGASIPEELRTSGKTPYLLADHDELGYNYRMTDLQGAVGVVQLSKLDGLIEERNVWARWYNEALADIEWLRLPSTPAGYGHAWQAYVTVVDEAQGKSREDVMGQLDARGVSTRPGTHAVVALGLYRRLLSTDHDSTRWPVATHLHKRSLAIPLHNRMTEPDFEYVVDAIRSL